MIGLLQIGATMGQITYNQLKREQTMNKQHTFCFKIEDVAIETLHYFLEQASKNHLFVDLPDILQDSDSGRLDYEDPTMYYGGCVDFTDSKKVPLIGIDENGIVVTYSDERFFGENTVVIQHPHSELLEHHLQQAAPKKQEQKTTEATNDDEIVQLFQTTDGRQFKTLAEAESHHVRERLIEKWIEDTACDYETADMALNWIEANHPKLKED